MVSDSLMTFRRLALIGPPSNIWLSLVSTERIFNELLQYIMCSTDSLSSAHSKNKKNSSIVELSVHSSDTRH